MLKASALYIVIIIALVIALLCSSLVVAAYFFRLNFQKNYRYDNLQNNLSSANNILLSIDDTSFSKPVTLSLYHGDNDSVILKKIHWGIFDIGIASAFIQSDTLHNIFSIANIIDSTKWAVLYLRNEKHPLTVSGKTVIKGNCYLPSAGITSAYVNHQAYSGNETLVNGHIYNSAVSLPALSAARLDYFETQLSPQDNRDTTVLKGDSISNSFSLPTQSFYLGKKCQVLQNIKIAGNIIIYADSTLVIEHSAQLDHIIIFAKSITVKEGFSGNCQLFARDSISIEKNCKFTYPSCLGAIRLRNSVPNYIEHIHLGDSTIFNGTVFIFEQVPTTFNPTITLDKNSDIIGQVYVDGILDLEDGAKIGGGAFADRLIYKTNASILENYLINAQLDASILSPYYLTSDLMPVSSSKRKILEWLEKK